MSLKYRIDTRTLEQFATDIKFRTEKEKCLMYLYVQEMKNFGYDIKVINNGVDNSGELCKKVTARPDYKIFMRSTDNEFNGCLVYLVEIKNSPVSSKWTFKVSNLRTYVKCNAHILIFWGTGYIDREPENIDLDRTFFGIITPKKIESILESYQFYQESKFGNKTCVQIPVKDFDKWLKIRRITQSYEKEN